MARINIAATVNEITEKVLSQIKSGLLMPNSCWTCKHCATYRWKVGGRIDEDICMMTGKIIKMDDKPWEARMSWCPFVLESEDN